MSSNWISEIKQVQHELGCSYKEAMIEASRRRKIPAHERIPAPMAAARPGQNPVQLVYGDGAFDRISQYWSGLKSAVKGKRMGFKPSFRKVLEEKGDVPIIRLDACRVPLSSKVTKLMTLIGITNNTPHDQLYHLSLIVTLDDRTKWRLEKNEDLNLVRYSPSRFDDLKAIPIKQGMTLNSMMAHALKNIVADRLFIYDAFSNNCQQFVMDIINANGIQIPQATKEWIWQDVRTLANSWQQKLTRLATDAKNLGNQVIEGAGQWEDVTDRFVHDGDSYTVTADPRYYRIIKIRPEAHDEWVDDDEDVSNDEDDE